MTDNHLVKTYANKIENKLTLKIKLWYYFELLTHETGNYLETLKIRLLKMKMVKKVTK